MGSFQNNSGGGWLFDYGICDDAAASDLIWAPQIIDDPMVSSTMLGFEVPCKEGSVSEKACSRKRNHVESLAVPGTKAFREKLRRDKLNDRFTELCSILDPGRPPKADKVSILGDASRRLNHLRGEAEKIKESNKALQDNIKSLKEEKLELRDEKVRLKAEKERIEQMLKAANTAPTFIPYPPASNAAFASYKTVAYPSYVPVGTWQWLPTAELDTSQDHVLRPPVA
ncbi:uncharacterized protein A4U43_C08F36140 [Asparagus officinalis]|uniref:transcription factor ILR3-like n=1 Tax=Asparagus officinalis TaxID=4686 RepID=UPI00098DF658|nr:transcription factor ILR3-like [Asparagus officinalis]ONK62037.1 uncharacterized protein A4U43_C08F36140 [Asparagus officinalis]